MADTPLFGLDAEDRWRLAYDPLQWIVQKRCRAARARCGLWHESGFQGVWFIGSTTQLLEAFFRRKQIELTAEAYCRLRAMPPTFKEFWASLDESDQEHLDKPDDADLAEAAQ